MIFLFLGSVRSVIIPVVAIPISLIGAVFLMLAAGFTINLLTLLAIVLSVGSRRRRRDRHGGERRAAPPRWARSRFDAALHAARELVGPIIAMTITLAAVYTPVAIQGGLTGALFREFAFTLAGAVIVSGVVALTLSPMMASRLLRAGDTEKRLRRAGSTAGSTPSAPRYTRRARRARCATGRWCSCCGRIVVALMVPFYMFSQQELAPVEDQGVVFGIVQAAPNATLDQTKLFTTKVYDVYKSFPETGEHLPDHVSHRRLRRHGHQALERADEDDRAAPGRGVGQALRDPRASA